MCKTKIEKNADAVPGGSEPSKPKTSSSAPPATNPRSYTCANAFPTKLLAHALMLSKKLVPIHPQVYISNDCQMNCLYCSCARRRRSAPHMPFERYTDIMTKLREAGGAMAVTLSGGGEPLLNPDFEKIVRWSVENGVGVGLVTNGIAVKRWPARLFKLIKWCRISMDGAREELPDVYGPDVFKFAYSWVYHTGDFEHPNLLRLMGMAKLNLIHHLRIVSDLYSDEDAVALKTELAGRNLSPNIVPQIRSDNFANHGKKNCWLPLVKPAIDVDGLFYTCCGAQYALPNKDEQRILPNRLCMGTVDEFLERYVEADPQRPFPGHICTTCYYNQFIDALDDVRQIKDLEYKWFV